MKLLSYIFIICKGVYLKIHKFFTNKIGLLYFSQSNIEFGKGAVINGLPILNVSRKGGRLVIGNTFKINNGKYYNQIGRQQPCYLIVGKNACLTIGNNVGMSSSSIVCRKEIKIGNNVKIGGNVVIYDTDFHSLFPNDRIDPKKDTANAKTAPVLIGNNVFIGAHSTILKGVEICDNSIVGACSVVTKNIPANEIWAGNPAKFIRKVPEESCKSVSKF